MTRPNLTLVGGCDFVPRTQSTNKVQAYKHTPEKSDEPITATARNSRLRLKRREVWRAMEALTHYWRARHHFESAASMSVLCLTPEGRVLFEDQGQVPFASVDKWREALVRQLLTPAPDANSVKWKQTTFAQGQHRYTDVKPERIERAISDDMAWLAAHPTKRSIRATKKS